MGEYYARNFVFGPLLITTRDTRTDLAQWDLLFPFFHYRQDLNSSNSWLFPLYWSGEDRSKGDAYRYLLPFYGSSDDQSQHYNFLFPLLWLRRQHFGPGHAIQPARPASS